jgi:uncharacterized membrane protein YeaQ/YmgE (transglycosylase-associated protein family)
MSTYYFTFGLTYILIGFCVAMVYFYVFKKNFLGSLWGGVVVGIIGSFIGGLVDFYFKDFLYFLSHLFGSINLFPPLISAVLFLWIFNRMSNTPDDY